ncbi:hypothetical protein QR680_012463 [Steinernema hermaphroditum]|uniref:Uncharacterized protein n=1 Tax=Steinernema hermaphroditum TaxID=289476 RepID=A0AA39M0J5_9BILA|nr:hypothetical protein QR680_012463 [Steinernema hermaphroditum]
MTSSPRFFILFVIVAIVGGHGASLRREKGAMSKAELLDLIQTVPYAKKTTQRIQILAPYLASSAAVTTQRREVIDAPTVGTPPLLGPESPFASRRRHSRHVSA